MRCGCVAEAACDEPVAPEREQDPRRAGGAAEARRECAQRRTEVDRVPHAAADVRLGEVADRRARARERLRAGGVEAEAERLREHHDHVEHAAEANRARDRERDVAPRVVRLLAESGSSFEAAERQQPEHRRERNRADAGSGRRHERLEREVLAVRRGVADDLPEDDDHDDHDQRHRDAFERQQRAADHPDVAVGEHPHQCCADQRDQDPRRAVPDAAPAEERRPESTDLRDVRDDEQRVRREQRPAGEEAGARAERHARKRVGRARVVEVGREPDERVRDERDRDRREQECERDRAADQARRHCSVERHRRGRRHDPHRDRDRLPESKLTPKSPA